MSLLRGSFFGQLEKCCALLSSNVHITYSQIRHSAYDRYKVPRPGPQEGNFRFRVNYPAEYTVKPLKVTHLGGRDPVSGRKIVEGIGGGYSFPYHWIFSKRDGPSSGPPLVEKVIQILKDGNRTAFVALVASGDTMKYYLATENMKPGQLVTTSREIPKNPVLPVEGNAHPLGSMPEGTIIHNIERVPGGGAVFLQSAGSSAKIIKQTEKTTIVKMPNKHEFTFDRHCLAVVGKLSNPEHCNHKYKSMTEWKIDGHRSRSGLYHKKDGRFGRKIKKPLQVTVRMPEIPRKAYNLTISGGVE